VGSGLTIDENGVLSASVAESPSTGGTSPDGFEIISNQTTEKASNSVEWEGLSLSHVRLTAYLPIASTNSDSVFIRINGIRTGYLSPTFLSTSQPMVHDIKIEKRGDLYLVQWRSMRDMASPQQYVKQYGIPGWWGNEKVSSIKLETQTTSAYIPVGSIFVLEGIR